MNRKPPWSHIVPSPNLQQSHPGYLWAVLAKLAEDAIAAVAQMCEARLLGAHKSVLCSLQLTGNGSSTRASVTSGFCRPSRIALTRSGAKTVSRRTRVVMDSVPWLDRRPAVDRASARTKAEGGVNRTWGYQAKEGSLQGSSLNLTTTTLSSEDMRKRRCHSCDYLLPPRTPDGWLLCLVCGWELPPWTWRLKAFVLRLWSGAV